MARKKGTHSAKTLVEGQKALKMALEGNKTQSEIAEELGVHPTTVSERINKYLNSEEVKATINQSRNRLVQMLPRADAAYLRILDWNAPENFGNQYKVATTLYRTFGCVQDEPQTRIENLNAIVVKVDGQTFEFTPPEVEDGTAQETGPGVPQQ